MRESVTDKADRLLIQGAVAVLEVCRDVVAVAVQGDHDRYAVTFKDGRWRCTCPAPGPCSHGLAAARVTRTNAQVPTGAAGGTASPGGAGQGAPTDPTRPAPDTISAEGG